MENGRFKQLEERVRQLELEVESLKKQGVKSQFSIGTKSVSEAKRPIENKQIELKKKPVPAKESEPVDWEHLIGRVWLPRIFIFVLLLGLVWGFKVAVDYGILTEPIRVVLGFSVAVSLYVLGEKQLKNGRLSLGKSLLIGAIGLLILTTFAMNVLYGMVPTVVAFSLNVIWVGVGLFLAQRYQSRRTFRLKLLLSI